MNWDIALVTEDDLVVVKDITVHANGTNLLQDEEQQEERGGERKGRSKIENQKNGQIKSRTVQIQAGIINVHHQPSFHPTDYRPYPSSHSYEMHWIVFTDSKVFQERSSFSAYFSPFPDLFLPRFREYC